MPPTVVETGIWRHRHDRTLFGVVGRALDETHEMPVVVFVPFLRTGPWEMLSRPEPDFLRWYEPVDEAAAAQNLSQAECEGQLKAWGLRVSKDVFHLASSGVPLVSVIMEMAKNVAMSIAIYDNKTVRETVIDSVVKLLPASVSEYLAVKSDVTEAKTAPRH